MVSLILGAVLRYLWWPWFQEQSQRSSGNSVAVLSALSAEKWQILYIKICYQLPVLVQVKINWKSHGHWQGVLQLIQAPELFSNKNIERSATTLSVSTTENNRSMKSECLFINKSGHIQWFIDSGPWYPLPWPRWPRGMSWPPAAAPPAATPGWRGQIEAQRRYTRTHCQHSRLHREKETKIRTPKINVLPYLALHVTKLSLLSIT